MVEKAQFIGLLAQRIQNYTLHIFETIVHANEGNEKLELKKIIYSLFHLRFIYKILLNIF